MDGGGSSLRDVIQLCAVEWRHCGIGEAGALIETRRCWLVSRFVGVVSVDFEFVRWWMSWYVMASLVRASYQEGLVFATWCEFLFRVFTAVRLVAFNCSQAFVTASRNCSSFRVLKSVFDSSLECVTVLVGN